LLRVDSPAGLRGSVAARGVEVTLALPPDPAIEAAVLAVPGVTGVDVVEHRLIAHTPEPAAITPAIVRALVLAGADVVTVAERATSLEQVYFEVMGVRPDQGEAA
jgi:hypothetical protein